jgi:hypothetical protein
MEDAARLEVGLTLVPQPTTELEELLFVEPLVELLVVVLPQPASNPNANAAPTTKNARFDEWKRRTTYPQI